ncbi:hypothetical protein [Sporichthya brevicatena]|uniref:type II secretion system F family protein n=1 Tax=Sporichthya brevicatena TaxID=171442 RepID=UPI0031E0449A
MTVLAALAAACAVGLAWPGGPGLRRLGRVGSSAGGTNRGSTARRASRSAGRGWFARPSDLVPRRVLALRRTAVVEFAGALGSEIRAGRPPRAAVVAALAELPPGEADGGTGTWAAEVRAAAGGDGDVGAALIRAAEQPGADSLRDVAACWEVAERTGAGLGGALDQVAATAGERVVHQARVRAQLAGVRTTGWLLAALPLVGMALAALAGAHPWRVLLATPSGVALLTLGVGLDAAGVVWLYRLARRVEETL